ncbi:hypothetical protein PIB30_050979 [Stylosanthes scabra]|uniref:RALF-like protein n=1 Tax=Stylosanthes scabra TaxID=79078 RepID=A0ABU6RHZ3_9FABA|nr:hypothetical protein [Stylosanthes scabra]
MASKRCSLIWALIFLGILCVSVKAIEELNNNNLSGGVYDQLNYATKKENLKGVSRRLVQKQPPCRRGRLAYDTTQAYKSKPSDNPRCHNYL